MTLFFFCFRFFSGGRNTHPKSWNSLSLAPLTRSRIAIFRKTLCTWHSKSQVGHNLYYFFSARQVWRDATEQSATNNSQFWDCYRTETGTWTEYDLVGKCTSLPRGLWPPIAYKCSVYCTLLLFVNVVKIVKTTVLSRDCFYQMVYNELCFEYGWLSWRVVWVWMSVMACHFDCGECFWFVNDARVVRLVY